MGQTIAGGKCVDKSFVSKVMEICQGFGWGDEHASWLMSCMAFESAETFCSTTRNAAGSGAVGLIQFMPRTAKGLDTNTAALAMMTPVEQLFYVKKYFLPYYKRITSLEDMYMAILLPSMIGKPLDAKLFTAPGIAYRQNSGLDADKDGTVTKFEAASKVRAKLIKGLSPEKCLILLR